MKVMPVFKRIVKIVLATVVFLILSIFVIDRFLIANVLKEFDDSPQYSNGTFHNLNKQPTGNLTKTLGIFKRILTEQRLDNEPQQSLPMSTLSVAQLQALNNNQLHIVKLGHSSLLLKVYGEYWLIDPVFSKRASPFSFMGPKRYQQTPIDIEDLPTIDRIIISHNHYDHLDKHSIMSLAKKTKMFFVPLGIEGDLQKWGVPTQKIMHFDWWQEHQDHKTLLVLTPAQHFSGRGLSDRNTTLWGSWVIKTDQHSLYYSGDSGYFDGFKAIGTKYGPFDITFIETGAYNKRDWPTVHMLPEDSVKAHLDLNGDIMVAVHNGTFDLAFHPWYEPLERVDKAAQNHNVKLSTPLIGQIFDINQVISDRWWQTYINN